MKKPSITLRNASTGRVLSAKKFTYKSLGRTSDGVFVLTPKAKPGQLTSRDIKVAVERVTHGSTKTAKG